MHIPICMTMVWLSKHESNIYLIATAGLWIELSGLLKGSAEFSGTQTHNLQITSTLHQPLSRNDPITKDKHQHNEECVTVKDNNCKNIIGGKNVQFTERKWIFLLWKKRRLYLWSYCVCTSLYARECKRMNIIATHIFQPH